MSNSKSIGLAALVLTLAACTGATPTGAPARVVSQPGPASVDATPAMTAVLDAGPASAGTLRLAIDPTRSKVSYAVDETFINQNNTLATTIGQTSQINGRLNLNLADPTQSEFGDFTVDISTLRSDSRRRDEAIRRQWLESAAYPVATFVARRLANFPDQPQEGAPIQFQLLGDLTVKQTTRAVTWDVTATLQGQTLSGQARTSLLMADFGVEPPNIAGILSVKDGVTLTVDFVMLPIE